MNVSPQFSPDGRWVAFISTNGGTRVKDARGLAVVDARGGTPRTVTAGGTWVGQFAWAADSGSLFFLNSEGTFGRQARMFEQPIGRIPIGGGQATFLTEGPTANYAISLDSAGGRLAYRSVASGTVGDVYVKDLATDRTTRVTDVNPQVKELSLGETRAVSWRSFDGMEIWGLLVLAARAAQRTRAVARLLPWRPDRRLHLGLVSAVRAPHRSSGALPGAGDGERRVTPSCCRCRAAVPATAKRRTT